MSGCQPDPGWFEARFPRTYNAVEFFLLWSPLLVPALLAGVFLGVMIAWLVRLGS